MNAERIYAVLAEIIGQREGVKIEIELTERKKQ